MLGQEVLSVMWPFKHRPEGSERASYVNIEGEEQSALQWSECPVVWVGVGGCSLSKLLGGAFKEQHLSCILTCGDSKSVLKNSRKLALKREFKGRVW